MIVKLTAAIFFAVATCATAEPTRLTTPIVDTGQVICYGPDGRPTSAPAPRAPLDGQDAQYGGRQPVYKDNGDGTVSDLVTGLMWTQDPGEKRTHGDAVKGATTCRVADHKDWRLPTIKELYSLILFSGTDPDPQSSEQGSLTPFIDRTVFDFQYGNADRGERLIDSQFATSTLYVSTTMGGNKTMFGVNFADGRIKGYPVGATRRRGEKTYYVLYVRDNPEYGRNRFKDNSDGTVTDGATGLTWTKADNGKGMDWPTALRYAESLELAGHSDWRLPDAKELQSIVDYTRSPDTTGSAAIDPIFAVTEIKNEGGAKDFPCYWTGTSHVRGGGSHAAVYIAFGRGLGWMPDRGSRSGEKRLMDVHGAGCQRSDPKTGDASRFPQGRGPQGDVIRILNYVRAVRGGSVTRVEKTQLPALTASPRLSPPSGGGRPSPPDRRSPDDHDGQAPAFVSRLDRDGDNRVSRNEFDGPPHAFSNLDANRDGFLTEDEAPHRHGHPLPQRGDMPDERTRAVRPMRPMGPVDRL